MITVAMKITLSCILTFFIGALVTIHSDVYSVGERIGQGTMAAAGVAGFASALWWLWSQ
jgi:hypothetical protein